MFNSDILPNSAPLLYIMLRNLSDIDFDLLRSHKVNCDSVIELPIYGFLVVSNSNVWPNCSFARCKPLKSE